VLVSDHRLFITVVLQCFRSADLLLVEVSARTQRLGITPLFQPRQDIEMKDSAGMVLAIEDAALLCKQWRYNNEKVVLTNGCFDLLHAGHVAYLEQSSRLGDHLIVLVNSDESVKELKGPDRPVNAEFDRASVISALKCVDAAVVFRGPRLIEEITCLAPDIYTKAGDYTLETLHPGELLALQQVNAYIRFLPFLPGYSTTKSIASIGSLESMSYKDGKDGLRFATTLREVRTVIERSHSLDPVVQSTGDILLECLRNGGKLLTCGNGGSAADAMHLAEELVGRYSRNRVALPAISLNSDTTSITCIGNDFGFDFIYSRAVEALGKPGDLLVCFTTSGNSHNVLNAIDAANQRGLKTILLTGKDGGRAKGKATVEVVVPSDNTARIQEVHTMVLHQWLERVDEAYA